MTTGELWRDQHRRADVRAPETGMELGMTGHSMIRIVAIALMLALVGLVTAPVLAHEELRFVGTVTKMDLAKGRLAVTYKVSGKDETVEVTLTDKTEITRDKKAISRSDLAPGLFVVVDALGCEDEYEGVSVRIVPPPAGQ